MSSCLSGGGRTAYVLDLDIIKSSSPSFRTSHSSSPSSTISESSNSPITISTRKARTPRKRPNQTYNEAAVLLSTAYPNIFSTKDITKPCKFIKPHEYSSFSFEDSSEELLLHFPVEKPIFQATLEKPFLIETEEIGYKTKSSNLSSSYDGDFDTESILDEEIEEGVIDSIMGDMSVCSKDEPTTCSNGVGIPVNFCYGYPMGFGLGLGLGARFEFGYGVTKGGVASAFRQTDGGDWWRYPTVDMGEISPKFKVSSTVETKKKVEKSNPKPPPISNKQNSISSKSSLVVSNENSNQSKSSSEVSKEDSTSITKLNSGVLLKLNYDEVLSSWSDRGSPFSEDAQGLEFSGSDALARLAQIDLFGETGALREASVQRYKEKRRTRLFSKKIRYQVRKVNAEQRPRMKGRFVRRPNSSSER